MAGGVCQLSKEADAAIQDLLTSDKKEFAIVLKCVMQKKELTVDYDLEDTDVEEIGSELADTLPRIILFKTGLSVDESTKVDSVLLINFNPLDTPLDLKGTYNNTFKCIQRHLETKVKSLELNDVSDFRLEIVQARARGLTGTMAPGIIPVKQTYGRELV